jgi:hypothetical protein
MGLVIFSLSWTLLLSCNIYHQLCSFFDTEYSLSGLLNIKFLAWSLEVPSSPSSILSYSTFHAVWRRGSYFPEIMTIQSETDHSSPISAVERNGHISISIGLMWY